eukprot:TRINITY_DN80010_c0_g1_i1.p1 TRINITY_DN80010_c0_g1~~TRINITY_DN80010_c0_g1_i1.p1  ORF type:complete len:487 (-),score=83.65 TRINITY_DN80010_c0_g1_i1:118-1521(-)
MPSMMMVLAVFLGVVCIALPLLCCFAGSRRTRYTHSSGLESLSDIPQDTLFAILQQHLVPMEAVHANNSSLMEIVQLLLGVVPGVYQLLEIWPPAFQCYKVTVMNFLNLPALVLGLGTRPSSLITLAMYASSRAAECAYCSAHTCTIAMRRGVAPSTLQALFAGNQNAVDLSPAESASVAVARSVSRVPCELRHEEMAALHATTGKDDVEWIAAAIAMFGLLNKLMDGLGVPIESETHSEVANVFGPKWKPSKTAQMLAKDAVLRKPPQVDDWRLKLKALWLSMKPGGMFTSDAHLLRGMPTTAAGACAFLQRAVGHPFPVLAHLKHSRFIRAVGAVIYLNFNDTNTAGLTCARKIFAAAVAASTMEDIHLLGEMIAMGVNFGVTKVQFDEAIEKQRSPDRLTETVLQAAKALASSPANMTAEVVLAIRESQLSPAMLVELVSVLACTQMLHRLERFYFVGEERENQ